MSMVQSKFHLTQGKNQFVNVLHLSNFFHLMTKFKLMREIFDMLKVKNNLKKK